MVVHYLPERQESTNGHVYNDAAIPRSRGDLTRNVLCATRSIKSSGHVLPKYTSQDSKGEAN